MSGQKLYKDRDWLEEQYVEKGFSAIEIAKKTGVSGAAIYNWMKKFDINTCHVSNYWKDKEKEKGKWLEKKYIEEKLSAREIAGIVGCSHGAITYYLHKFDIPIRDISEYNADRKYKDREWLEEKYKEKDLSIYQIAEKVDCQPANIARWLHKLDIGIKKRSSDNPAIRTICTECRKKFHAEPFNFQKAKHHFCSRECYYKWLQDNKNGKDNPNWKGGYEPYYGGSIWKSQRKKALRRDDYTCQKCGAKENLVVHHKTPVRVFKEGKNNEEVDWEKVNELSNLQTFCKSCHRKVENAVQNEEN